MAARRIHPIVSAGSQAPDFRLELLDGGETTLVALLEGGPVLLAFFKISCPTCQLTFPFLERLHKAGLRVYGISQNDPEDTREFNRYYGVTFPALLDPEDSFPVSNAYGISTVPTMFLVQPDGAIASVSEGWSKREIESFGALAGASPFRDTGRRVPEFKPG